MDGKLLAIHSLLEGLLVDDDLVAVDQMLLELMGKDSLEGVNLIGIADLLNDLSHFVVSMSRLEESQSSLGGLVGSEDNVSFFASNGGVFVGLDNDGMCNKRGETVDMNSEFNFDEVSLLDVGGILLERGKVAADLIGGDGGGEGKSLESRFFVIDL